MKKKVLSLSLVVIMLAILSFSSLAWFTDNDSASNDFQIAGAGSEDPDKIFSVDVKEEVDGEDKPVDEMKFGEILPGAEYKKAAYVSNTGSYNQYIRVTLTITDWNEIKDIVSINMDDKFAENWYIDTKGVSIDKNGNLVSDSTEDKLVVVLYLNNILKPDFKFDLMDSVSVSEKATQADFANFAFADGFQIDIKADAVQTENVLDSYGDVQWENAKASFEAVA